jgi:hypothetical protein
MSEQNNQSTFEKEIYQGFETALEVGNEVYEELRDGAKLIAEGVHQSIEVGVWDAGVAFIEGLEAKQMAESSGLTGAHNGHQDALRHCEWSCEMAKEIGSEQAKEVGIIHEQWGFNPPKEVEMDLHNNAVGLILGEDKDNTCESGCMKALENGDLQILNESEVTPETAIEPEGSLMSIPENGSGPNLESFLENSSYGANLESQFELNIEFA